jgi:hypothetical protein
MVGINKLLKKPLYKSAETARFLDWAVSHAHECSSLNERTISHWSLAVSLGGLIVIIVWIVMRLTHADNTLFLVIFGLLCGLGVCLGAFLGWKEYKFAYCFSPRLLKRRLSNGLFRHISQSIALRWASLPKDIDDHPLILVFRQVHRVGSPPGRKLRRGYLFLHLENGHLFRRILWHFAVLIIALA